jgi:hypothetical protein
VNSRTASYHLRRLAVAGFVEEDTGRGNARERWWRSVHRTTEFSDRDLIAREPEAVLAFLQSVAATYGLRLQQALDELQTMPEAWRGTFDMSDWGCGSPPRNPSPCATSCGRSWTATGRTPRRRRRTPPRAPNGSP